MALRVKISARAANEIRRAAEWWEANRPAAPGAVRADLGDLIALLAEQPGIGARYEGTKVPGIRRLLLGRLGYFLYYEADEVELRVLALWHASRERQPSL